MRRDSLAGGESVIAQGGESQPAQTAVRVIDIDVPRADHQWREREFSGDSQQPAVLRAMCVEHLDFFEAKPTRKAQDISRECPSVELDGLDGDSGRSRALRNFAAR